MNEEESLKNLKQNVMETIVIPSFKNDIISLKNQRKMWDIITTGCILISAISAAITVVLIAFKYQSLSLLSSSITVAFQNLGHISRTQSQSKTTLLNTLLSQLGITPIFKDITSHITPSASKIQDKYLSQQQLDLFNSNVDEDEILYDDKINYNNISVILSDNEDDECCEDNKDDNSLKNYYKYNNEKSDVEMGNYKNEQY